MHSSTWLFQNQFLP